MVQYVLLGVFERRMFMKNWALFADCSDSVPMLAVCVVVAFGALLVGPTMLLAHWFVLPVGWTLVKMRIIGGIVTGLGVLAALKLHRDMK
jgi:hypothetical protein